mmetsp:Transcript_151062/g.263246  ORF Transcript_151062/g.263246 Transcript_151062/m.263246 type:complete len:957 (-) Transcript_151062:162-3032(-)
MTSAPHAYNRKSQALLDSSGEDDDITRSRQYREPTASASAMLSVEQRRRNEITVHRASKISYDKSFDARGSFVHFAQHGIRNFMHGSVRNYMHQSSWYDSDWVVRIRKFLNCAPFVLVSLCCLLFSMFLGDVFVVFQVPGNTELNIILTLVFAIFVLEFLGLTATEASYPFSFFFWMDMLGTLSMAFDISYMLGSDATQPELLQSQNGAVSSNVVVVRTARAARLGARAGRLSRALKILRFLPFVQSSRQEEKVKMARVISNQLNDVLSTRVAFLTICVAIMLPMFGMFKYPEMDESLAAWAQMLNHNAHEYYEAVHANTSAHVADVAKQDFLDELSRFVRFYSKMNYGPFDVCYGREVAGVFECRPDLLDIPDFEPLFHAPWRRSSIWYLDVGNLRASFNLSQPKQMESVASIAMICFIIIVMCFFGLVMSSSISIIALQPLERMLAIVRERCAQIFKYTSELQEGDADVDDEEEEEEYGDKEQSSEFVLLEKAVSKLAAIAHLSTTKNEPEVTEEMNENDIMVLNMMGTQVPAHGSSSSRLTVFRTSYLGVEDRKDEEAPDQPNLTGSWMLTSMTNVIPQEVMESLNKSDFNTLDLPKDVKITVSAYTMLVSEGSSAWVRSNVQESQLYKFMSTLESKYLPNPFHSFAHALDVLNAVYRFMSVIEADRFLSEVSQFWLMVAAIGHDIGHIGVNNQYLVEVSHELALTYNDRSPLENMHCAKLYQVVGEPESNIFAQLEKDLYKEMRKGIIDAILHTDVTRHNEMIKELSLLYQMNSEAFDSPIQTVEVLQSQANTQLIMNALLHFADVANPMKPWDLCRRIAYLCVDEFFAQGDMERARGIPVQMLNDRDKVNKPNSQIGFIEFMICPFVESMVNLFPQLDELADNLASNVQRWSEVWIEQVSPPSDAVDKVNVRVQKVVHRCRAVRRLEDGDEHGRRASTGGISRGRTRTLFN